MKPYSLTIERFGSFREKQAFYFPQQPGLYFMRGMNRVDAALDANGAGKTTVWNALTWLFFDKNIRGLRAGDVCTWGDAGTVTVELEFQFDGGYDGIVVRTWNPNRWELYLSDAPIDLVKAENNAVLEDLRLSYQTWLHSVIVASGEPMFLDMKPEPKAAFLSEVLGLDKWLDRAQRASKKAADQDRESREIERALARAQGNLEGLSGDVQQQHTEWEKDLARQVVELDATAKRLVPLAQAAANKGLLLADEQEKALALEEELKADIERLRVGMKGASAAEAEARDQMVVAATTHDAAMRHSEDVQDMGDWCPLCGQGVNDGDHKKVSADAARAAKTALLTLSAQIGAHKKAKAVYVEMSAEMDKKRDMLRDVGDVINAIARDVDRSADECKRLHNEKAAVDSEIDRLSRLDNPFKDGQHRYQQERDRLNNALADLQAELDGSNSQYRMLTMWATEFKTIRLQQMEEALQQLEIEVNSKCVELGLVGWELRFGTDKVGKRGSVSKGFTVTVLSPHNADPVPWESWSGGETQRLRLAGQMGLADLVRARTGAAIPLEVWDEPTQGLSAQGITDLLDCLKTRAQQERRQVWVVDHHSLGYGAFDGVVTVVKERTGSVLEISV